MKIAAVLVTFNRKALLQEGLNSLRRELPVGTPIIVVDNASTDGTAQFLQEEQKQFPLLVYFISPENTGGAGGFASGLEIALRKTDADWFFLIDDDVEVLPGAFQVLEKYKAESQCLQFTKVYADGYREPMAGHFDIKAGRILFYLYCT
jgi:GT2 family glycosyltransferase